MSDGPVAPEPKNESFVDPFNEKPPAATSSPTEGFTHFETLRPTTYELPLGLQPAVLGQGESSSSWIGPVHILGNSGSRRSWRGEVDRDSINTLLFTGIQVIGLMLGPDDLQNLQESGPLTTVINQAIQSSQWSGGEPGRAGVGEMAFIGEDAIAKGVQFASLNARHWGDMVDALTSQPLQAALVHHLNYGLPYAQIQSVEVKYRFITPWLSFHLTNGSSLRYGTFGKRDQLGQAASYLNQYIKAK